jgi:hypothetical protein
VRTASGYDGGENGVAVQLRPLTTVVKVDKESKVKSPSSILNDFPLDVTDKVEGRERSDSSHHGRAPRAVYKGKCELLKFQLMSRSCATDQLVHHGAVS